MTRTALLAGTTGLIGSRLLPLLLASPRYTRVKALARRPLALRHEKLETILTDLADPTRLGGALIADDVFCCLGTTIKKAGSQAAFVAVDEEMVVALAQAARTRGAKQFLVVSSVGADPKASSFYLRVKGQMEARVQALGYPSVQVLRPSLLLGAREESRPGERLAQGLTPLLAPLMRGPLAKYRSVRGEDVAAALLRIASRDSSGTEVHHGPFEA